MKARVRDDFMYAIGCVGDKETLTNSTQVTDMTQDDEKLLEALERARQRSDTPAFTSNMHARLMRRLNEHEAISAAQHVSPNASAPGWLERVKELLARAFEPTSWLDPSTGALRPSTASSESMVIKVTPSEDEDFFEQVELRLSLVLRSGKDHLAIELVRPSWVKESWAVQLIGAPYQGEELIEREVLFHDLTESTMFLGEAELGFSPERLVCVSLARERAMADT